MQYVKIFGTIRIDEIGFSDNTKERRSDGMQELQDNSTNKPYGQNFIVSVTE